MEQNYVTVTLCIVQIVVYKTDYWPLWVELFYVVMQRQLNNTHTISVTLIIQKYYILPHDAIYASAACAMTLCLLAYRFVGLSIRFML